MSLPSSESSSLVSSPSPERWLALLPSEPSLSDDSASSWSSLGEPAVGFGDRYSIAFAFDIDGVLVKGKNPVPEARETIQMLQKANMPFIFLTNGGGLTEADHVAKLGQRLDLKLDEKQFVQSHTPFYDLVPEYKDKTVLVLGGSGHQIRDLANAYGFNKVVTTSDLMAEWEHLHPFPEMTKDHHAEHGRRNADGPKTGPIAAIMVWTSPRDWCLDLQVVTDLLLSSGGQLGAKSAKAGDISLPNNGYLQDGQPKLFFCNPDFEWATQHDRPRFAQGAFREALQGIWNYATKGQAKLEYTILGKPTEATYIYGERVLQEYHEHISNADAPVAPIKTVYMIGDNPESDICGANAYKSRFGAEWKSVLVETGVHVPGSTPLHKPKHIAKDVKSAVHWALRNEGIVLDEMAFETAS